MAAQPGPVNLSVGQFAERYRREMIPLGKNFSYFSADLPFSEEEVREYLQEPVAAMPLSIAALLPKISILLVPYLEKPTSRSQVEVVTLQRPSESRASWTSCYMSKNEAVLAFAVKDQEVADYHYRFYHMMASLVADKWSDEAKREYTALVRHELLNEVHGEVDEKSWHMKQQLLRRQKTFRRETKLFAEYARQSFIDTLTLYLHGICCDIDVETGPRQLPSRFLRRRLDLLRNLYPAPDGYAVFPEELVREEDRR
ncbi:MAG TPA: hypothetical protein VFL57_08675 [Bryobacteraceae bacterium]|nr:hypothetical protein [Bryobacteraceae bacterium]